MLRTGQLLDKTVVGYATFVPKLLKVWCNFVVKTVCKQNH